MNTHRQHVVNGAQLTVASNTYKHDKNTDNKQSKIDNTQLHENTQIIHNQRLTMHSCIQTHRQQTCTG